MNKAEERAKYLGYGTDPLNRAEYTANEVRDAFIDGYCDAIEKAVEWLENNLPPAMVRSDCYMFNGKFIEDFKIAMEGGK